MILALGGRGTYAAFSDSATVTGGAFTSGSVTTPSNGRCDDPFGAGVDIKWTNVDVRYRYRVQVLNDSGTVIGTAAVANNGAASGIQTLHIDKGEYGTKSRGLSREHYTVQIRSEIGSEWSSPATPPVRIFYNDIFFVGYIQCG